jgi:hypothetical protein
MKNETREKRLLSRLDAIRREISQLGEVRVGSLTRQHNVCGNPNCACRDPENPRKHGPYHQLSFTRYGKSTSEFVKAEDVEAVRESLENYKALMRLKDEWIDISIFLSRLRRGLGGTLPKADASRRTTVSGAKRKGKGQ